MPVDILEQKDNAINQLSLVTKLQPLDTVIMSYSGSEIIFGFSYLKIYSISKSQEEEILCVL